MSHQTGIKGNEGLKKIFGKSKDGKIRAIKISIENEELNLSAHKEVKSSFQKDYEKMVMPMIEEDVPCYILFRLDTKNTLGYDWLLISWTPDSASVRFKMLYASTKATLKNEFGTAHIKDELHATTMDEVTYKGYTKHIEAMVAPAPLTMREEELKEIRQTETHVDISTNTRQQTLSGVAFPITESAMQGIKDMARDSYNYLQFKIEFAEEKIHLVKAANIDLNNLKNEVPEDSARYHLYNFKHTHEGDYTESIVFIYSMPGYNCSIKERMLYSSCKAPFLETIQSLNLPITKKLEIDSGSELTEEFLQDELHPKKNLHRPLFAKPKGPPNRGAKRLTKPN
ncbi:twinfilin-like [Ctenocephalides felis]|uniref:twinfilin-like n=1 Tax=Ctenocephalides felis TaxID=7515 RepID=UPI000E6E465D|nr:twinfilin-like [Ctenocephalides felis]